MPFGFGMGFSRVMSVASAGGGGGGDPYWTNVSLLLNETATNTQTNNVFLDSSSNNFTITRVGAATQGALTPYTVAANTAYSTTTNGGSGYFEAGGNYISVADSPNLEVGSQDFTIESWIYLNSYVSSSAVVSKGSFSPYMIFIGASTELSFYASANGTSWAISDLRIATAPALNTWHHVAVTRSGTTFRTFFNGVLANSVTLSGSLVDNASSVLIGYYAASLNGYVSNFRMVTGTAVYTASFTPPTSPLSAVAGTQLLLNFTNAGVYDAAAQNDIATAGTAQVSTTQTKWAPTSLYLNGASYAAAPAKASLQFLSGDFTIEGWIYTPSTAANQQMINQDDGASGGQSFTVRSETNGTLGFIYYTTASRGSGVLRTTSNTIPTNAWVYIAISRTGSTLKMYINGVQGYTGTDATMYQGSNPTTLGGFTSGLYGSMFTGYMQDIRITKGVGRYPATCAVPTAAFVVY